VVVAAEEGVKLEEGGGREGGREGGEEEEEGKEGSMLFSTLVVLVS
jgi:hypothetical protein